MYVGDGPIATRRAEYAQLNRAIFDAERALQNNPEVIHALKEGRNLCGSEGSRTALERYEVIDSSSEAARPGRSTPCPKPPRLAYHAGRAPQRTPLSFRSARRGPLANSTRKDFIREELPRRSAPLHDNHGDMSRHKRRYVKPTRRRVTV